MQFFRFLMLENCSDLTTGGAAGGQTTDGEHLLAAVRETQDGGRAGAVLAAGRDVGL